MQDESFNIVKQPSTLLDRVEDGSEVIIGQNNIGGILSDVTTRLTLKLRLVSRVV